MAENIVTIAPLVEIREDPAFVEGGTYRIERNATIWSAYTRSPEACENAGAAVVSNIVEHSSDIDGEGLFDLATYAAVQRPPLTGSRLEAFVHGAREAVNQRVKDVA